MQCWLHPENPAAALCANCGRAVCRSCLKDGPPVPATCCVECSVAVQKFRTAVEITERKTRRSNRASAWFLWLSAAVFIIPGVIMILSGVTAAGVISALLGAVFALAGFWYFRVSQRDA
jgi:hypothetical protein